MEDMIVNGLRITPGGQIVDAETGEPFGNGTLRTGITLDTSNSEVKTLEEMGCDPLVETEEEYKEAARRQGIAVMRSSWEVMYEHEHPGQNAIDTFLERQKSVPFYSTARHDHSRKSKYEVMPDTSFVVRFGILEKDDGRFLPVIGDFMDRNPDAEAHWVKFRMWSYDEMVKWRSEFMEFNSVTKSREVNAEKLNEKKIRSLLLDWSFGNYGDDMKLFHCDGKLSDESYSMFINLYPSIANAIVDLMNMVLDTR